ncbi:MAG: ABC transporter permease [Phycisphaerae bacterium]|nr:ABC transporter permease [Phycisphaerae bacterium]
MMSVALKMLVGDRLKYLGLVAGIAFAALLITQQASILIGLAHQTGSFIRDTAVADLWVMDPQVRFSQDALPIRDTTLERVRGVDGVQWAVPMYQGFLKARLPDGTRVTTILVGVDDATLLGGPPRIVRGTLADLRGDNAVFIDESALDTKWMQKRSGGRGLRIGDRITINDKDAVIAGTYSASQSFFWEPITYPTYTRALRYAPPERNLMVFTLVKVAPGQDVADVAARIARTTGLDALTGEQFIARTADYILKETGILVNFGLAVGLGFVIGTLIAGQMLYNFTLDNLRHYGALKAMGAGNWLLVRMTMLQVLTVGALGLGIGVGAATYLGRIVGDAGLAFRMPWQVLAGAAVAILVICTLAGLLSIVRVLRLEPAVVFKA